MEIIDMIKSVFLNQYKKKKKLNQEFYPDIICIHNNPSKYNYCSI